VPHECRYRNDVNAAFDGIGSEHVADDAGSETEAQFLLQSPCAMAQQVFIPGGMVKVPENGTSREAFGPSPCDFKRLVIQQNDSVFFLPL
jgi:hypothetical protein